MRIESVQQACDIRGWGNANDIMPDFSMYPEKHRAALQAVAEMFLIVDASRSKDPDWNDGDEEKWTAWMDMEKDKNNPSGFRFCGTYYVGTDAFAGLGSRLCFESSEEAKWHLGEKHLDKMRAIMVIEK
jgi:hypothetical protein